MTYESNHNTPAARCLTLQQLTICQHIGAGMSPAEIAEKLSTPEKAITIQLRRLGLYSPLGGEMDVYPLWW